MGQACKILTVSLCLIRAFQFINHFHNLTRFSKKSHEVGWTEFLFFKGNLGSNGVKGLIKDHITHEKRSQNKTQAS